MIRKYILLMLLASTSVYAGGTQDSASGDKPQNASAQSENAQNQNIGVQDQNERVENAEREQNQQIHDRVPQQLPQNTLLPQNALTQKKEEKIAKPQVITLKSLSDLLSHDHLSARVLPLLQSTDLQQLVSSHKALGQKVQNYTPTSRITSVEHLLDLKNKKVGYGFYDMFSLWSCEPSKLNDLKKLRMLHKGPLFVNVPEAFEIDQNSLMRFKESQLPIFGGLDFLRCKDLWPQLIGLHLRFTDTAPFLDTDKALLKEFAQTQKRKISLMLSCQSEATHVCSGLNRMYADFFELLNDVEKIDLGPIREIEINTNLEDPVPSFQPQMTAWLQTAQAQDLVGFRFRYDGSSCADYLLNSEHSICYSIMPYLPMQLELFSTDLNGIEMARLTKMGKTLQFLKYFMFRPKPVYDSAYNCLQGSRDNIIYGLLDLPKNVVLKGSLSFHNYSDIELLRKITTHFSDLSQLNLSLVQGYVFCYSDLMPQLIDDCEKHPELDLKDFLFALKLPVKKLPQNIQCFALKLEFYSQNDRKILEKNFEEFVEKLPQLKKLRNVNLICPLNFHTQEVYKEGEIAKMLTLIGEAMTMKTRKTLSLKMEAKVYSDSDSEPQIVTKEDLSKKLMNLPVWSKNQISFNLIMY